MRFSLLSTWGDNKTSSDVGQIFPFFFSPWDSLWTLFGYVHCVQRITYLLLAYWFLSLAVSPNELVPVSLHSLWWVSSIWYSRLFTLSRYTYRSQWYYIHTSGSVAKSCLTLVTLWTVAHQALQSMEFSRQENWSGLPFPSPGDLHNPGIELGSPALQVDSLPTEPPRKPLNTHKHTHTHTHSDHPTCEILVPWPEIEPILSAVKAQSSKHRTAREFPSVITLWSQYHPNLTTGNHWSSQHNVLEIHLSCFVHQYLIFSPAELFPMIWI